MILCGLCVAAGVLMVYREGTRGCRFDASSRRGAMLLRQTSFEWQKSNRGACPTIERLVSDHMLESQINTRDEWGGKFTIVCGKDDVVVRSAGPDRVPHTGDDVVVPKEP